MRELLDAIAARAEDARRNREMYSKESRSRRITQEDSAQDVPRLLAAVRAVEAIADELCEDIPEDAANASMKHAGKVIRRALTDALEGKGRE